MIYLVALVLSSLLVAANARANTLFSAELTGNYTAGDFGSTDTTRTFKSTLFLGYYPNDTIDFGLALSHLYLSNSSAAWSGNLFVDRRGSGVPASGSTSNSNESVNGPGDIELSANLGLCKETAQRPAFRFFGKVKLPTADEDKGLGTGETDYTAGIGLSKWLGSWLIKSEGSYVLQGNNDQLKLDDYTTYEISLGYLFRQELLGEIRYWGATEPAGGIGSLGELHLELTSWLNSSSGISLNAVAGLTTGSLDYGFGGSVFVNF